MAHTCVICGGDFKSSPDAVVVCNHHQGAVHLGCCTQRCSWNNTPCEHADGIFNKVERSE